MMFRCPFVFSILTPDLSVRALAAQALRIGLLAEPLYGVSIVAAGALRGTGDTFVPSMMNLGVFGWYASGLPCCSSAISVCRACGRPWRRSFVCGL